MNTLISRAACAAVLTTALSGGFLAMSSAVAVAQVSPADPNYDYETRGKTIPWNGGAHAQAPESDGLQQNGADARASAVRGTQIRSRRPRPDMGR